MIDLDTKIVKIEQDERHIQYKFQIGIKPSGDLINKITQDIKKMDRQKEIIELIFPNNQSDELSLQADELHDLVDILTKRFKNIYSFSLNLNNWCYIYTIMPKLLITFSDLLLLQKLEIKGNNISLNPSFSNSAMLNLAKILAMLKKLQDLTLEFSDTSPQKKRQIKQDSLHLLGESFKEMTELKILNINFSALLGSQRCSISNREELNNLIINLFRGIFHKKQFIKLHLNLQWWELVGFEALIELFLHIQKQQLLKDLSLNLVRWSYFNDSYSDQSAYAMAKCLREIPQIQKLNLTFFDLGTCKINNNYQIGKNERYQVEKLEVIIDAIGRLSNLQSMKLKSLEYIPSCGIQFIKNLFVKNWKKYKFLTDLKIETDCTQDEYNTNFRQIIQRIQTRRRLLYSLIQLSKNFRKKFRKEKIWEISQFYYY